MDVCDEVALLMRQTSVLSVETVTGLTPFAVNDQVINGSDVPAGFSVRLLYCKHRGIDFRETSI